MLKANWQTPFKVFAKNHNRWAINENSINNHYAFGGLLSVPAFLHGHYCHISKVVLWSVLRL